MKKLRHITSLFNRPAFQEMIGDIEAGNINCVIVKDLSRFGRDYIDTGKYLERYFPEKRVRFISIGDNIDSFRRDYDMLLPIKNIFNEQYSRDISQKVHAAMQAKQLAGEFIGAFPSYGYKKCATDKNRLIIDDYAADIVRFIFDLYINGMGKIRIAGLLNEQNVLCPAEYKNANGDNYRNTSQSRSGSYWTYSAIHNILKNEMYIGNMVQGRSIRQLRGKARPRDRENWIVVAGTHEAVLDTDTWNKAQSLLKRRVRTSHGSTDSTSAYDNDDSNISIFAGFLKCGDCGRALRKRSGTDGSPSYRCGTYVSQGKRFCTPHSVPHDALVNMILCDLNLILKNSASILDAVSHNETLAVPSPAQNRTGMKNSAARKNLLADLDKVRHLSKVTYGHLCEDLITREEYMAYRQEYQKKEDLISCRLEKLDALDKPPAYNAEHPWTAHLLQYHVLESLDRDIIIQMVDNIKIFENNRILITYRFSDEQYFIPK